MVGFSTGMGPNAGQREGTVVHKNGWTGSAVRRRPRMCYLNAIRPQASSMRTIVKMPVETPMNRRRLVLWQGLTIALLFSGYAGYYLCRSDFSVSLPLIRDEMVAHGMSPAEAKIRLGAITSFAVLAYAIGKFFFAGVA